MEKYEEVEKVVEDISFYEAQIRKSVAIPRRIVDAIRQKEKRKLRDSFPKVGGVSAF